MAWWDADPVVDVQSPEKDKGDWWKSDPVAEPPADVPAEIAQSEAQQQIERNATGSIADLKTGLDKAMMIPGKILGTGANLAATGFPRVPTDAEVTAPTVTPEQIAAVMPHTWFQKAIEAVAPNTPIQEAVTGLGRGINTTASGLTSLQNASLLGIAPEGKLAQRLIAGTFLGQSLLGTPEQWQAFKEAPTLEEKVKIGTEMGLGIALPTAGLLHAKARAGEVPKVEGGPTQNVSPIAGETDSAPPQEFPRTKPVPLPVDVVPARVADTPTEQTLTPAFGTNRENVSQSEPSTSSAQREAEKEVRGIKEPQAESVDAQGQNAPFVPSTEWQEVPAGTVLPNGGEYRMDQATGKNYARWKEDQLPSAQVRSHPSSSEETTTEGAASDASSQQPPRTFSESIPQPETTPTSTKNATTDLEREARNIAPAVEAAKRDFGTVWDEAAAEAQADPGISQRLVESVAADPRALSDKENAHLLRRQIEVQNEHDAAIKAVNEAPDEATRADASTRLERVRDDLQTVYDAAKSAGTETGRGLNARKMLANNDYSLAKMEATTRAVVNNGKALSERQAADVKALHERIRAAEEKVSAYEARDQFETELRKAKAEARKTGFKPQSFLEQQAQRARERIIARRGKLFADPVGVTQIAHLADEAIIGASHIARGITKFADWSAQMIADFGERIKPHLQALYAKARELHSQTQYSQPLTGRADMLSRTAAGESRFERQIGGDKKRIQANIEKVQAKTAAGDFSRPEKQPPRMDKQKAALLFEFQKAKEAYHKGLIEAQFAKQSIPRKTLRYGGETLNTTRALMTSFDLSAVLRQGGFIAFGHPFRALRAFPDMIRALRSEKNQFRVMEDIRNRPNAPLYQQAKLYIADQGPGVSLSKMEEQYMSRWARHIPGVGASERAYTTFLNRLRADSFDAMAENLGRRGKVTLDEAKAISNFVNVATGRGNLDAAAKAATGLNTFFFAPRYVVSRFQLLAGQPFMRGSFRTRGLIAKEYGRTLAGAAVVYALGQSAGATIDTNPTSPDFLKLKFGNTRVDPLFGLTQSSVFLSREALALKRFVTQDQSKQPKYGTGGEVLGRFLRSKLAPAIGGAVDALSGKNVVGQKVTPGSVAQQLVVPLSFGDIYNAMKDQGVPRGTILGILAIFGMGVQNYAPKPDIPHRSIRSRSLRQVMDERRLDSIARDLQAA